MKGLILRYALSRLRELSTWQSFFLVLASFGLYLGTAEQQNALAYLAMALAGGTGMVLPDRLHPPVVQPVNPPPSKLDDLAAQFGDK